MSRQITLSGSTGQNYAEALRKMIPSEVLVFYAALVMAVPLALIPTMVVTILAIAATPVYLFFAGDVKDVKQLVISSVSMAIYSVLFGSLESFIPTEMIWIPTIVAITWTFLAPFLFVFKKE
jgi:hypothetical protein